MKITFTVGRVKQNTDFNTNALKEEWSLKVESKDADGMASSCYLLTRESGVTPGKYSGELRISSGVIRATGKPYFKLVVSNLERLK